MTYSFYFKGYPDVARLHQPQIVDNNGFNTWHPFYPQLSQKHTTVECSGINKTSSRLDRVKNYFKSKILSCLDRGNHPQKTSADQRPNTKYNPLARGKYCGPLVAATMLTACSPTGGIRNDIADNKQSNINIVYNDQHLSNPKLRSKIIADCKEAKHIVNSLYLRHDQYTVFHRENYQHKGKVIQVDVNVQKIHSELNTLLARSVISDTSDQQLQLDSKDATYWLHYVTFFQEYFVGRPKQVFAHNF